MSLCDGLHLLLESYGVYENVTTLNSTSTIHNSVFQHWCHYDSMPTFAHYFIGIVLIFICSISITGNLLVIVVFSKYRRLRSPANTLILNLAFSDMFNGLLHPLAAYSAFKKHWMFGKLGCELYAGLCGLFGLVSIVSLTAIAIERCLVISVKPWYGGVLLTQAKSKVVCFIIWIYCFGIVLPPFFGWGAFVPEGFLTSCSFDYITRTNSNRSYFFYIFTVGFFFPVSIIVICYFFILRTIYQNGKDMKKNNVKKAYGKPKKRNDYKAAEMIMIVIGMFLISWTPYSVIAMIGQFGNRRVLTPWVSVLPSLFAKMSTIYNPAIYGLSHRHFRATLKRIFKKDGNHSIDRGGGGTNFSKNSSLVRSKNACPCFPNCQSDFVEESSSSLTERKVYLGVTTANVLEAKKVIYVKRHSHDREICNCKTAYEIKKKIRREIVKNRTSERREIDRGRSLKKRTSEPQREDIPIMVPKTVVLAMSCDSNRTSLVRSLMFKSEGSIHQKYQTFLEEDHIVRIPSSICNYGGKMQYKKSEAIILYDSDMEK